MPYFGKAKLSSQSTVLSYPKITDNSEWLYVSSTLADSIRKARAIEMPLLATIVLLAPMYAPFAALFGMGYILFLRVT